MGLERQLASRQHLDLAEAPLPLAQGGELAEPVHHHALDPCPLGQEPPVEVRLARLETLQQGSRGPGEDPGQGVPVPWIASLEFGEVDPHRGAVERDLAGADAERLGLSPFEREAEAVDGLPQRDPGLFLGAVGPEACCELFARVTPVGFEREPRETQRRVAGRKGQDPTADRRLEAAEKAQL